MFGNRTFGNGISLDEIKTSSSAFVSVKNKTPDARIAIAMPPRIGTNIMLILSSIVHRSNNRKIEMRLFILYNLQLEIINFLYKNLRKAEC